MSTWMSRLTWITAVMVLPTLVSGCAGTAKYWRRGSPGTSQVATLPMVPSPQEYQTRADATAQPRFAPQTAGATGGCGGGSCCSSGSCGTSRAATNAAPPTAYGYTMVSSPLPESNSGSTTAAAYGGQKTCPVTDEPLGSMGDAIPVNVKGQTIYVCCAGCVDSVQSDPDLYLAKVMRERSGQ